MTAPASLAFSHVGIFVTDLETMVDFYTRVLGFTVSDRGPIRDTYLVFLTRDPDEHHQLVLAKGRPPGLPFNVVNQISFRVPALDDLKRFHAALAGEPVTQVRTVSHGNAWSVYFHDPEGNRIEVFVDSPWHTPQPCGDPLDLSAPVADIVRKTEAECRARPGFKPRAEWRKALAERLERRG